MQLHTVHTHSAHYNLQKYTNIHFLHDFPSYISNVCCMRHLGEHRLLVHELLKIIIHVIPALEKGCCKHLAVVRNCIIFEARHDLASVVLHEKDAVEATIIPAARKAKTKAKC